MQRPPLSMTSTSTASPSPSLSLAPDQLMVLMRSIWWLSVLILLLLPALPLLAIDWQPPAPLWFSLRLLVIAGGLVMLGELIIAASCLVRDSHRVARASATYLRIRTPNPEVSSTTIGMNPTNGADLWYAMHRVIPPPSTGWVAATLSARPDEPVEFGVLVGGGTTAQRNSWATALRHLIIGHNAEAVVESRPDPLAQAIQQARGRQQATLAWAEFLLPHSPAYPLRVPTDAESDLLGPLVAQIRPQVGAVRYSEVHVVGQPCHDWRADSLRWRAAAYRRLSAMKRAVGDGILSADGRALDAKLDSPAMNTVLRIVLVAERPADATRLIREVGTVLGQYSNRSGSIFQRWLLATHGMADLSKLPPHPSQRWSWPTIRRWGLAITASIFLSLLPPFWPIGLWPWLWLDPTLASILPWLFSMLWLLTPLLLAWASHRAAAGVRTDHWTRRLQARAPRLIPPTPWILPIPAWWAPAILSAEELGGVWHLPSPNLGNLVRWLPARHLPAPPHAFVTSPTLQTPTGMTARRLILGHAVRSDGHLGPVGPSLYDLRNIMHVTAGMGGGKSRLFANLAKQLLPVGLVLIDGKGDDAGNLTTTVRQYIPREDERRVVLLDITDTDWPISLNPLAGIALETPGAIDRVTAQIQSIFARLDPEGWTNAPGMQQFLDMGTRLVVEAESLPTVAHVKQALIDEAYRKTLLKRCRKLEVKTFWEVIYPSSSDQQKTSMHALMRRFDKLLLSDLVRNLMSQERPTFRFDQAIQEQLIVLCPIPHVTYGPLAATAAMLMFQSFLRAAFDRPGTAATRSDYPLIVDEFQVLVDQGASADVAVALTQLRSLGVPTCYAHQALTQIGTLREVMMVNAENRVLIRTQEPDATIYANHYQAAGLRGADIANQEPGEHHYGRFLVGGKPVGPISMVPLDWPTPLTILPDSYDGPDWQTIVPRAYPPALPGPHDHQAAYLAEDIDHKLLTWIYQRTADDQLAQRLAEHLDDQQWYLINSRWEALARTQRQYILDHPGCIPDRDERVRWLSRLGFARPKLLAEVAFLRIRRATGFDHMAAQAATKTTNRGQNGSQKGNKKGEADQPNPEPPLTWPANTRPDSHGA